MESTVEGFSCIVIDIERFSDLEKLLKLTAFAVRFVSTFKKYMKKTERVLGKLVVEELVVGEKLWLKYEQSIFSSDKL